MVGTLSGPAVAGKLTFKVTKLVIPTASITVGRATVGTLSGIATITGTITCHGPAVQTVVNLTLRQVKDGFLARGSNTVDVPVCGSTPTPWRMTVEGESIRAFVPGWASVNFNSLVCDTLECFSSSDMTKSVFLNGVQMSSTTKW
jgi:hypothetical protein